MHACLYFVWHHHPCRRWRQCTVWIFSGSSNSEKKIFLVWFCWGSTAGNYVNNLKLVISLYCCPYLCMPKKEICSSTNVPIFVRTLRVFPDQWSHSTHSITQTAEQLFNLQSAAKAWYLHFLQNRKHLSWCPDLHNSNQTALWFDLCIGCRWWCILIASWACG